MLLNVLLILIVLSSKMIIANVSKFSLYEIKEDILTLSSEEYELLNEVKESVLKDNEIIKILKQYKEDRNLEFQYTFSKNNNMQFIIKENDLSYGRGYVYSLQYHLVWCTKYRKKVLQNGLDEECKKMLYEIADEYKFQIVAMEVMPDHIHLLVDCKPQFYISDMIKIMKGNLARQLFLSHPELKRELWGGHLWNPSYCAVTVSDRSKEQVLTYIKGQKEKEAGK